MFERAQIGKQLACPLRADFHSQQSCRFRQEIMPEALFKVSVSKRIGVVSGLLVGNNPERRD
jgi:hypothetical protein